MKKLFACISLMFLSQYIFSADFKVDATGAIAGSYATIQSAVNAAANGDRIVVFNNYRKNYYENITLNKSLTVLCAAEEEYFSLTGNITVTPANGREITIVGCNQTGNITSASVNPVGARCTVNIVDCKLWGSITFNHDGFDVNVLYSVITKTTEIRHGKIIANELGKEQDSQPSAGEVKITAEDVSYGTGDTVFIVANRIWRRLTSSAVVPVEFNNVYARYFIANNSIRQEGSPYETAVRITACLLTDSANAFMNNYVEAYKATSTACSAATTTATAELKGIRAENLVNNIFFNRYNGYGGCALLGMRGDYNYYHGFDGYPLTAGQSDNNISTDYNTQDITFNPKTGKVTAGVDGIDKGKPGVPYMDIDLTRADFGTYGGPYSQENYWDATNPQGGRARVFLLQMPSNIYSLTSPAVIKASSTHTK